MSKPFKEEVIEKVIDGSETKTLNFKKEVFFLDDEEGLTRSFSFKGTNLVVASPLLVANDMGKIIGAASLEVQGTTVVADFFIDSATPERLTMETDGQKLWPHLGGQITTTRAQADEFKVIIIDLLPYPTKDPRVECIKL